MPRLYRYPTKTTTNVVIIDDDDEDGDDDCGQHSNDDDDERQHQILSMDHLHHYHHYHHHDNQDDDNLLFDPSTSSYKKIQRHSSTSSSSTSTSSPFFKWLYRRYVRYTSLHLPSSFASSASSSSSSSSTSSSKISSTTATSLLSSHCFLWCVVILFAFMLLSTHLYTSLQPNESNDMIDNNIGSKNGAASSGNGGRVYSYPRTYQQQQQRSISNNKNRSNFATLFEQANSGGVHRNPLARKMVHAIDQNLANIERSLQENRAILQQIRANIHLAERKISVDGDGSGDKDSKTSDLSSISNVDHQASTAGAAGGVAGYRAHLVNKDDQFYQHNFAECHMSTKDNEILDDDTDLPPTPGDVNMHQVYDQISFDNPDGGVWKQGWPLEAPPEQFDAGKAVKLKVLVVPHSHNDPGWIKTFDTYFREQTKNILTNAVEQLSKHPRMRLIWAEASYLSAWWQTAPSDEHREQLRQHIRSGRLEVVTGGWVMNDEANTHYSAIIAQMIEGHEWLWDTFGIRPQYGWAIDPFGMSPTMAYLLKRMGIRGMVVQRVHYVIKKFLAKHQQLEFRWRQHWENMNAGIDDILAHIQPFYSYDIPHTCGPDPAVCCQFDFKRLPGSRMKCPWKIAPVAINEENIEQKAKLLLDQYRKKSTLYRTKTLLVPLGDDFRYDKVKEWNDQYENYQKLFDYMNTHEEMNVEIKFGTLSDYFETLFNETGSLKLMKKFLSNDDNDIQDPAVDDDATEMLSTTVVNQTQLSKSFSTLVGDFFTYADREDHYWSGYYTSKPFYKRFERILGAHLRATEILFSLANIFNDHYNNSGDEKEKNEKKKKDTFETIMKDFQYARQNLALFQHHDGITGTAKDFVVKDYAKRMYRSFTILEQIVSVSLQTMVKNDIGKISMLDANDPNLVGSKQQQPNDDGGDGLNLEFMERFPNEQTPPQKRSFSIGGTNSSYFILYNTLAWSAESQLFCFNINWHQSSPSSTPNNNMMATMPTDWCLKDITTNTVMEDIQINHRWSEQNYPTLLGGGQREICFQPQLGPLSLRQYCIGNCQCQQIVVDGAGAGAAAVDDDAIATATTEALKKLYQRKESFVTLYNYHESNTQTDIPTDSHILALVDDNGGGGGGSSSRNVTIENERITLWFDSQTGLPYRISLLDDDTDGGGQSNRWIHLNLTMQVMTYGTRKGGKQVPKSGAYIFLPDQSDPVRFDTFGRPKFRHTIGPLESRFEVILERPLPIYIRFALIRGRRSIDLTTECQLMGLYGANKELLLQFQMEQITNNDGEFFTDLNGFQLIQRKWYDKLPVQGNVYPLNTMAFIESKYQQQQRNKNLRFTILTGQPLGVTTTTPTKSTGIINVFLDRRLTQDDARGLNQGVMDNRRTREQFRLLVEWPSVKASHTTPRASSGAMFESHQLLNPILGLTTTTTTTTPTTTTGTTTNHRSIFPLVPRHYSAIQFVQHSLPCDVHLLNIRRATLRPAELGLFFHRFGYDCDSTCAIVQSSPSPLPPSSSRTTSVSVAQLFTPSVVARLDHSKRLIPHSISLLTPLGGGGNSHNHGIGSGNNSDGDYYSTTINFNSNLTIEPMEIVAYKMYISTNNQQQK